MKPSKSDASSTSGNNDVNRDVATDLAGTALGHPQAYGLQIPLADGASCSQMIRGWVVGPDHELDLGGLERSKGFPRLAVDGLKSSNGANLVRRDRHLKCYPRRRRSCLRLFRASSLPPH